MERQISVLPVPTVKKKPPPEVLFGRTEPKRSFPFDFRPKFPEYLAQ